MLINRAFWLGFRAALGHESAGAVNGSGATGRLQISGGAPIFNLTARTGVLAILWPLRLPSRKTEPIRQDLMEQNHVVFDDASQGNIAEIA
jgi:hypothetical protein